jgi:hypothetical protein
MKIQSRRRHRTELIVTFLFGLFAAVNLAFAQSWTQTIAPITNLLWGAVAASADGSQIVATARTGTQPLKGPIYISSDSGRTWISNTLSPEVWTGIASSADGTKLVSVASLSFVYTSTNSGTSWGFSIPIANWSCVASSADGTKLVAAPLNGSIYTSTNSGGTWSPSAGTSGGWKSVASSADGTKLVAAAHNSVYTSTDSGNTWTSNSLPDEPWETWASVASSANGNILAVAAGGYNVGFGYIYVSTNSGSTWTNNNSPVLAWQSVASSADGKTLVAAALTSGSGPFSNSLFISKDLGVTWVSNNVPAETWTSVASSADGNMLVAGTSYGGVWISHVTPSPQLNISTVSSNMALSWIIPSTNLVLQQNLDLATTNWLTLTNTPALNLTNLRNQIMLPPSNGSGFYRLASP